MIENSVRDAFFELLRRGLWGSSGNSWNFTLSGRDWQLIFDESVRQTVAGITYRGLETLPDRDMPSDGLIVKWTAYSAMTEKTGRMMDGVVAELFRFLEENGLHPVLLKGQAAARLYSEPYARTCGDIDVYFALKEEWKAAAELIRSRGIDAETKPDGSFCYLWQGVEVEHHRKLFDLCDPFKQKWLGRLEKECGFVAAEIGGRIVRVPSPMLNLLIMSSHIMKHYFGLGIGLRQLCDLSRAYDAGGYCPEDVRKMYDRAGILKWGCLLDSFLAEYIGLPVHFLPSGRSSLDNVAFTEYVLSGGNFGHYRQNDNFANSHIFLSVLSRKFRTLASYLRQLTFSFSLAPAEAFWTIATLAAGQFRRK
ncbi:MAG: nucleotidyltransferase family protein [Candidatus Cryptobacteroides sp.]